MKVGIITFHFAHNYGAMLQAYALLQKIKSMGHETYIIDYAPKYHTKRYLRPSFLNCLSRNPIDLMRKLLSFIILGNIRNKRWFGFEEFKNREMSLYPYKPDSDFSEFDLVFLGSDQIWNPEHTNNRFDGPYYGEGFKCRVASYAASSRFKSLSRELKDGFHYHLKNLYAIGVRESSLQELLQPLTEKHISLNLDPTLIVDKKCFDSIVLERPIQENYVLVYQVEEKPGVIEKAQEYAKEHGLKVICLVAYPSIAKRFSRLFDQEASPKDFLSYIKNANCVFTSSFHGTALSIVFEKQFYSIRQHTDADLRLESILEQLQLTHRFISLDDTIKENVIDYCDVNRRLIGLRKESEDYLRYCMAFDSI